MTWPTLDTFDYGTPTYGGGLGGYFACIPLDTTYTLGALHNAYPGGAASTRGVGATSPNKGCPFVRRQMFDAPQDVRATFYKYPIAGNANGDTMVKHGVIARMNDAQVVLGGGTPLQRFDEADCYTFEAKRDVGGTEDVRLILVRWVNGVAVVLAETTDLIAFPANWAEPHTLRMVCTDDGGNVRIRCYASGVTVGDGSNAATLGFASGGPTNVRLNKPYGGSGPPAGVLPGVPIVPLSGASPPGGNLVLAGGPIVNFIDDLLIFDVTDSSLSNLQGASRCGFIIDDEQAIGGDWNASVCTSFEVRNPDTAAVEWLDNFERSTNSSGLIVTDLFGNVGRLVQSDYSRDVHAGNPGPKLTRNGSVEAVQIDSDINTGSALDLSGSGQYAVNSSPDLSYPLTASNDALRISVSIWTNIDTERDGNELFGCFDSSVQDGFAFGIREGSTSGQVKAVLRFGDPDGTAGSPVERETGDLSASVYLNATWCWVMTYRAAFGSNGEGRARLYVGRFGDYSLVGEWTDVPDTARPNFPITSSDTHYVGRRIESGGLATDEEFFDGTVDMLAVYYRELGADELEVVCDQQSQPADLVAAGAVHVMPFNEASANGGVNEFPLFHPPGVDVGDSWEAATAVSVVSGLTVDETALLNFWAMRPVDDTYFHDWEFDVTLEAEFSMAGVAAHVTPVTNDSFSGYVALVGVGSPAPVSLWRHRVGETPVKIARANSSTSTVNVALSSQALVRLRAEPATSGAQEGPVRLTCIIDSSIVPMQAIPGVDGVAIDSDGAVVDSSAGRLTSGPVVGQSHLVDSVPTIIDNWNAASGAPSPPTPASAYASLDLPTEATLEVDGDLSDVMGFEWQIERNTSLVRQSHQFDDGRAGRAPRVSYERRAFTFTNRSESPANLEAIRDFWDDHVHNTDVIGRPRAFTFDPSPWSPMDGGAGVFVFASVELADRTNEEGAGEYIVSIVEVRHVLPA